MRILQIGLGDFGLSWYKDILMNTARVSGILLADISPTALSEARSVDKESKCLFFNDMETALKERPDVILNVTPPHMHRRVIEAAVEKGIPVLSEKPIALKFEDARSLAHLSKERKVPVMIAENYRYSKLARKVRKLIEDGSIGKIGTVHIRFFRNHHMTNYHKDLDEPLLLDVAIHHMDLLRYFTGEEVSSLYSRSFNPSWSWYTGHASAHMNLALTGGTLATYQGSLASFTQEDDWNGTWRVEGSRGMIIIEHGMVIVKNNTGESCFKIEEEKDSRLLVLEEFMNALAENRRGETDISDNIKTFEIIHQAMGGSLE